MGCLIRSACLVKSNPKRPFTQRKSLLIPLRSRLFERRISWLRTLSVVFHPFEQAVLTVVRFAISHAPVYYRSFHSFAPRPGQYPFTFPHLPTPSCPPPSEISPR